MPAANQALPLILALCILTAVIPSPSEAKAVEIPKAAGPVRRNTHEHDHDDGDHDDGDSTVEAQCIAKSTFDLEFSEVAAEFGLLNEDSSACSPGLHGNETDDHAAVDGNITCLSCDLVYDLARDLVLHLGLASRCCLENETDSCQEGEEEETAGGGSVQRTDPGKAYGYGFLMAVVVSAGSLAGVLLVPCLKSDTNLYKYIFTLMIALGTSALFCDAILHLIPHALDLHAHTEDEEGHAHEEEEEEGIPSFIWKGCAIIGGIYVFFLLEVVLHAWNNHHHHSHAHHHNIEKDDSFDGHSGEAHKLSPVKKKKTTTAANCPCEVDVTVPHGQCSGTTGESAVIIHPGEGGSCAVCKEEEAEDDRRKDSQKSDSFSDDEIHHGRRGCLKRFVRFLLDIKPLAWLIILGDGIHNFADGLALGAAISQSVALGLSTTIALIFHEIPHEVGDYVILLSTGMSWYSALTFNLISALTAILGFFVGVAIGTESLEANGWILAAAAGIFIYIALVDLLPELIHTKERGRVRWIMFAMANIGFLLSFIILLLIAIYEEELDTLIKE